MNHHRKQKERGLRSVLFVTIKVWVGIKLQMDQLERGHYSGGIARSRRPYAGSLDPTGAGQYRLQI
jgi:hypothetical protein